MRCERSSERRAERDYRSYLRSRQRAVSRARSLDLQIATTLLGMLEEQAKPPALRLFDPRGNHHLRRQRGAARLSNFRPRTWISYPRPVGDLTPCSAKENTPSRESSLLRTRTRRRASTSQSEFDVETRIGINSTVRERDY